MLSRQATYADGVDLALPLLTATSALMAWRLDPPMLALALALTVAYLVLVRRARARGHRWPLWRTAVFIVLGVGTLVVATTSFLAVYRTVLFWPAATANTLLLTVAPMGIALGAPLRLVRLALPGSITPSDQRGSRWQAVVAAQVGSLPLLGALLGLTVQFALYFTPWFAASLRSGSVGALTSVTLLVVGALFTVPLLDEGDGEGDGEGARETGSGPSWGGRVLLAFGDGLLDAVPGMVIALSGAVVAGGWYVTRTPSWWRPGVAYDQLLGGELMVGVAEAVGVPLILAACIAWSRADTARAAAVDADLDAQERAEVAMVAVPSPEAAMPGPALDAAGRPLPEGRVRPWWETENRP